MKGRLGNFLTLFKRNFKRSFSSAYATSYKTGVKNAPTIRTISLVFASFLFGLLVGKNFLPINTTSAESPLEIIFTEEKARLKKLETENFSLTKITTESTTPTKKSTKKSTQPNNTIKIGGKILPLRTVLDTDIEAGGYVNFLSGYNFAFAHNYVLPSLSGVQTFTIKRGNKTETYKVVKSVTLIKKNVNMPQLVFANHNNKSYDLAFMTCAGRSLGSGDATHRLVLFANKL